MDRLSEKKNMDTTVVMILKLLLFLSTISCVKGFELEPPQFEETPRWPDGKYYDEDGPSIELDCRVTNTSHRLLWFKDGHLLDAATEQLQLFDRNQSLIFEVPKQFQTGEYKCLAFNVAGNVSHTGYILIIARKQETRPRIVETEPVNTVKHAKVGDTVNISCTFDVGGSVEALMDLNVEWLKGNETVNDTNHTTYGLNNTFKNNKISSLNIDKLTQMDYGTYKCYGENSKGNASKLISVVPPDPKHKNLPTWLIIVCSSAGVVAMATVVVIVIVVRHRHKMLQQKYENLEWPDPDFTQYDIPDRKIEYDVFISYSSDDLNWVKDELFNKLCDQGYEVCIDFKDFTPGVAIAENIIDAIYRSHKTIVLLSQNFLKSMWGQFELQQAHNRAIMQRTDGLILIKHDASKVPGKLMGKTFLDWSDVKVQPHFWTRLFEAIGEPGKFTETTEGNLVTEDINRKLSETIGEPGKITEGNLEPDNINRKMSEHTVEPDSHSDIGGEYREQANKNENEAEGFVKNMQNVQTRLETLTNDNLENIEDLKKVVSRTHEENSDRSEEDFQEFNRVYLTSEESGFYDDVFTEDTQNYEEFNADTEKIIVNI